MQQTYRKDRYSHIVFLHVWYRPIVGATSRCHELIFEDGIDGLPAALAILVEALD
jgi:hypothetical protein